jgi:type II secretory pathway pseudopilin PulG
MTIVLAILAVLILVAAIRMDRSRRKAMSANERERFDADMQGW